MTKTNHNCSTFKAPSSLKELLDFYAALNGPNGATSGNNCEVTAPAKAVLEELKKRLTGENNNGWIRKGTNGGDNDGIDWFFDANGKDTGCVMPKAILGLQTLRTNIHENKNTNPYTLPSNGTSDPCVKKYTDAIIQSAFPLFGCLFYLWFI